MSTQYTIIRAYTDPAFCVGCGGSFGPDADGADPHKKCCDYAADSGECYCPGCGRDVAYQVYKCQVRSCGDCGAELIDPTCDEFGDEWDDDSDDDGDDEATFRLITRAPFHRCASCGHLGLDHATEGGCPKTPVRS